MELKDRGGSKFNYLDTMIVAKGEQFLTMLTLVEGYDLKGNFVCYYVQHNKNTLPPKSVLSQGKSVNAPQLGYIIKRADLVLHYQFVYEAIRMWQDIKKNKALNGFSWLHGYLASRGIDMYEVIGFDY